MATTSPLMWRKYVTKSIIATLDWGGVIAGAAKF